MRNILEKTPPHYRYRALVAIVAVVFALSTFVSFTFAWSSVSQSATNADEGENLTFEVILEKFERDVNGGETTTPIPNAQFLLFRVNDDETSTQIGGIFTTNSNGQISVPGLFPGNYYFYELQPAPGFTFELDEYGNEIRRFPFTIAEGSAGGTVVVRAYNPRLRGNLIITKQVVGDDIPPHVLEQEFQFRITFSDGGPHTFRINGTGNEYTVYSGDIFTLRHGQSAVLENIPVGVVYTVTELPTPGFSINSNHHQGTITEDDEGRVVLFTNTWLDEVGSLRVTKEVIGITSDTEFTFTAKVGDETITFTLRHSEEWLLNNIPVGTEFTVTETPVNGYTATILQFTGVITESGVVIHLPFVNIWDEDLEDEYGSLRITKEVPGDSDTEFNFTVTFGNLPNNPVEILINGIPTTISNTNYEFEFTLQSGEYILFENIPHGITWSVAEHPEYGYIASIITANGIIAGNTETTVNFINHSAPEPPDYVEITITKIVEGAMPDPDQRFEFVLEVEGRENIYFNLAAGNSITFTIPAGVVYTITEINIPPGFSLIGVTDGHGTSRYGITAEFTNRFDGMWYIDIEGEKTWYYGEHNVTLPSSITIRLMNGNIIVAETIVTPDENGNWTFEFTNIPKYDSNGNEIQYTIVELPIEGWAPEYCDYGYDITNIHIPPAILDEIPVEKVITGDEIPAQNTTFRFNLVGQDNAPMPDSATSGNTHSITINGAGTTSFGSITFRSPGTFVYTITEVNTGTPGYIFDESIYTLTIVVEEVDGRLIITSRTLTRNEQNAERIIFTNEYIGTPITPPTGTVTISGQKIWEHGRNPEANQPRYVTFMLLADGELFISFAVNATTDWWYSFELPKYNDDGSIITWTVDEEYIPNYRKSINGFNITNTHISVGDPNWPDSDTPQTGDSSMALLWITLMAISLLGLFATFVASKKLNGRYKH